MSKMKDEYSDKIISETRETWQHYCQDNITVEGATEIVDNMFDLFALLGELSKKYGKDNDNIVVIPLQQGKGEKDNQLVLFKRAIAQAENDMHNYTIIMFAE